MRIGIDIRSLIEPFPSGVSEYTKQIVSLLLQRDTKNEYLFFYNSGKKIVPIELFKNNDYQSRLRAFNYPNKFFNTSIFLFDRPKIDKLLGGVDLFFMPNANFSALTKSSKLIVTVHDVSFKYKTFYSIKGFWWHHFIKVNKLLHRADKIIAVSESTKRDIQHSFSISGDKIDTIPLGVSQEKFGKVSQEARLRIKKQYDLPENYLLYFATVEKRKNIASLTLAWKNLVKLKKPNYDLIIAGRIGSKKLVKKVTGIKWLGYIPEDNKPALYANAKAFIYPSCYEGFGLPIIEAMAAGLPVIAGFGTSMPEVGQGSVMLVDPNNVNEISNAIDQLMNSQSLRKILINKARGVVRQYTWEKTVDKTIQLFNTLK